MRIEAIHHVQLAMPPGGEAAAGEFYEGLLGIPQVEKPPELVVRGGAWFERGDLRVHLGVEQDFRPARKAHAAFWVRNLGDLVRGLRDAGFEVREAVPLEEHARAYVDDPFGNRIELIDLGVGQRPGTT